MVYVIAILTGLSGAAAAWFAASLALAAVAASAIPLVAEAIKAASGLTGLVFACALTLRLHGDARTMREAARRAAVVTACLTAALAGGLNLRHSALAHLGIGAAAPSVEFEIRVPAIALAPDAARDMQVELRTDRNQAIAKLRPGVAQAGDGRAVLRGSAPIAFQTAQRVVVLNLPGQGQRLFKLRLAADPAPTAAFGPWHTVDYIEQPGRRFPERAAPDDGFAIRYRAM
jgi:hypothetical protein